MASVDPANRWGMVTVCPVGSAKHGYLTRVEVTGGSSGLDPNY